MDHARGHLGDERGDLGTDHFLMTLEDVVVANAGGSLNAGGGSALCVEDGLVPAWEHSERLGDNDAKAETEGGAELFEQRVVGRDGGALRVRGNGLGGGRGGEAR